MGIVCHQHWYRLMDETGPDIWVTSDEERVVSLSSKLGFKWYGDICSCSVGVEVSIDIDVDFSVDLCLGLPDDIGVDVGVDVCLDLSVVVVVDAGVDVAVDISVEIGVEIAMFVDWGFIWSVEDVDKEPNRHDNFLRP